MKNQLNVLDESDMKRMQMTKFHVEVEDKGKCDEENRYLLNTKL